MCRLGLTLKRGESLAERIDTGVLLLERINLALLRGKLPVLRLQPPSEFPCLLGLRFQLLGLLLYAAYSLTSETYAGVPVRRR